MNVTIGVPRRRPIALGPRGVLCAAVAWLLLAVAVSQLADVATWAPDAAPPPTATTADAATGSVNALPMAWVANTGQTDAEVRYVAQGLGYAAFLTDTEAVVRVDDAVVRLGFEGASTAPTLGTAEPLAATVSSFTGSDRAAWQSAAPTAEVVRYEDLWPGIDATFRGSGTHLEWDYHVAPGADPSTAGTTVAGGDHISIDGDRATLAGEGRELTLTIPAVWQTLPNGTRVDRDASWVLDGDTLRVVPEDWDPSLPGVIDPTLDWSTYLGGGHGGDGHDRFAAIAIDAAGNAFVTGNTDSFDFPTTSGAFDNTLEGDGPDAFVAKVDPTGGALVFSTIVGGSGEDRGNDIAVDATGNVYVVASTEDGVTDYPTTAGAYDTTHNGSWDAAVTKLDPTGGSLLYSTFLGGAAFDEASGVAVDDAGNAYVTGYATDAATDYPTTPGAYDTTHNGSTDAFVTKLNATGSALDFSTLLGGSSTDQPSDLAIDSSGRPTITGDTQNGTTDFPTTPGAYDTTHNGTYDVFVTRLDASGSTLDYSTLIGSQTSELWNANDFASGLALDGAGDAYVTGQTYGAAYPTTPGAYDSSFNGITDAFVTKLDATGSSLVFSTFLGGSGQDGGQGIATDPTGHAYVTGITPDVTVDFPTTPGAYDTVANGIDGFVTKLDPTGSSLDYSTRIGGSLGESGAAIAADAAGNAYITGTTGSTGYPTTAGAYDTSHNGANDGFVTKFNAAGSALDYSTLLGGSRGNGSDGITGIAADASGVYATGTTESNYFPTTAGAYDTSPNGDDDIFVAKLDPSGGSLIYSTVLGGSGPDLDPDIAIDANGHAYVTGSAGDAVTDFPTTAGAFDTSQNGVDVFVTRLNPTGTALDFSTFLGGAGADFGKGIVVDAAGGAYVTGSAGTAFPTTPGAYDTSSGGGGDAFVTKLTPAGDALAYSTLLGGAGLESAVDIALDAAGDTYVTGVTEPGFPVTPGAYDTTHNGTTVPDGDGGFIIGRDAFASKLNATGTALVYSTYLGGSGVEIGEGIAVDASGNVSVTGETSSPNYPTTPGAFDTTWNGWEDVFVTRLNASGSGLIFSTLLGGTSSDSGNAIAVDAAGYSYITGQTSDAATDYPVTPGAHDTTHGGLSDAFLTRLAPSGATLAYSTFIGGSGGDSGTALAVTSPASVIVGGTSFSADLATTPGAYDTVNQAGLAAGFVARFDLSTTPAVGGCKATTTPGAVMGMYPAQPGAQSGLRVACRFESVAPVAFTVHDFAVAKFHNGSARTVSTTGAIASGATTFTVASFAGTAGWVNRPITTVGAVPGLVPRTFVRSISGAGLVTLSAPTTAAIPAGTSFKIDNTRARSVVDGVTTASSSTLTSASANFTSGDTGLSVSGTNIPDGTTATFVNATTITLSNAATASGTGQTITVGATLVNTTTRAVNDAANTSATVITSSAAGFTTDDIGLRVTGPGIPANTYITAVTATTATTTGGLTPNTAPQTIEIGEPSATAPTTGDTAAGLSLQLDRDPAFFAGADPCANNTAESLALVGVWNNPGAFQADTFTAPQPAATKAIGQIQFHGGVLPLAAYVIERPALTPFDPAPAAHYDLVIPFMSTDVGTCKTPTSPALGWALGVHGQTSSQFALPEGTGKPGTAQLRSIIETPTGGYASTVYLTSDDPTVTLTPASEFNRLCIYPPGPATISFKCGSS